MKTRNVVQHPVDRLLEVVAKLRGEGGCPWDREQTLESLKQYMVEESYEVLDAIDADDAALHEEELGDLLLQIVLQARIREEDGKFTFADLAEKLTEKIIRRHPHVFGGVEAVDSETVLKNWEKIKKEEKPGEEPRSAVGGIPRHLPALQKAARVQSRASRVGFDWLEVSGVMAKVDEELAELKKAIAEGDAGKTKDEMGDLLFAVVNLCRFQKINAENALQGTVSKFVRRFKEVERRIHAEGGCLEDADLAVMDAHWDAVKREEE